MVTKIKGTKGKNGTSGAHPTAGGNGQDESFSQNGTIGSDSLNYLVTGGDGGLGGNGLNGDGAAGGNGGNAAITVNGNIFNSPTATNLTVSMTAQGGDGGLGGTAPIGFNPGPQGNGGNANVTMNGNIVQPSKAQGTVEFDAIAIAGAGTKYGNASATLNGNIFQPSKGANTVILDAAAYSNGPDPFANNGNANFGTESATISGNIVQGNVNNVYLSADTYNPATPFVGANGTATITGNIVQTNATNTGFVSLEASGQHIDIEKNKITLGKQELDLVVNEFGPTYDTKIKGNEFTGSGTNTFSFTDKAYPGPRITPDVISIDLTGQTFTFDGDSNKLKGFENATVSGSNAATITGDSNINILTGGDGNDLLTGGAGNDAIDGGAGLFDTAVYTGSFSQYTIVANPGPLGKKITDTISGRDGVDTTQNVEFFKFSDGLYDVTLGTFTPNTGTLNHAPAGADKTVTTLEDIPYVFAASDFGFTDPNDVPANALLAVKIDTLPTAGVLTDNGVAVTAGQSVSATDISTGKLVFTPATNANGAAYANFNFQVQDNGGTAGGGIDLDQSPNTITFNVTSVNDAPAGADKTVTTLEDVPYIFTASDFGFSDPNDVPANALLAVKIDTLPTAGVLTDNGVAVTAGQSVSATDISTGKLVFTPVANANGAAYANFNFQVQDNGGTANGGIDLDQSPNTITFNVTSVNDAPSGADKTISSPENTFYTFTASDFGFSDANDIPPNALLAVKIDTLPLAGQLLDNGVAVVAGQSVSALDITNGLVRFVPAVNGVGVNYANFTFQVQDNGGTANGGVDLDQSPNTITLNITPPNHAPAGADKTVTTLEDMPYTFTASDFGFNDPGDVPPNALLAVKIDTLPAAGVLTDNGVAVTAGQSVSVTDINSGLLKFAPAANANGAAYANFSFQVQDNGGTANGGVDLDQSPNTITLNVTSVNDAPSGADKIVTTFEDTSYIFASSDFGFTDSNDSPANALLAVKIDTLPVAGTLTDNGVAVTAGQSVSATDIATGKLVFTPAANANGAGYANLTFQVQDNGGTSNGGIDLDQSPNTITFNVTSVNDAPAGADKTVTTLEDTSYIFAASDFGFSDANDVPANALLAIKIDTLPTAGVLTDNGVAVTAGQSVSVADINSGLLQFAPAANANGAAYANFSFQVQDNGGTANGGIDLDQSPNTITLNVMSVNDAPAGADTTITALENGTYTFTASNFGFSDVNDSPANSFLSVKIDTLPAAGVLTDNGVAVTTGQLVSVADINSGLLQFAPAANASGNAYANFTFQVQDNGGTTNGGVDLDQSPNTLTVNVSPTNTTLHVGTGPGEYATITAALAAAVNGDTIQIDPGTYNENVLVNKSVTLQGLGAPGGVIIHGTFASDNGIVGPVSTWLQTAAGYSGASGTGVTVAANGVTLNNLTVEDFLNGVGVSGASVSGLTLEGVIMQHSVNGFNKPDDTALNGLTIDGSTFSDEYIGAGFYNDSAATGGAGFGKDATNTTITNSNFQDIDLKGVYMETAQGNTTLDGLTMNNVGQYGGVPSFGANGLNGNGIDLNLKYHTYAGTVDISGFNLTNTGGSAGQNGAIVVEGRDDASSYNTIPATVSGLAVDIHDGSINGTSTGIRAGENKANPAQNDTGPATTIQNVTITNASQGQIDNHTNSVMTVLGTAGNDTYVSAVTPGSTGVINFSGGAGDDTFGGGAGNDIIDGGTPGANGDTVTYVNALGGVTVNLSNTGAQAVGGGMGSDTITNIENLTGSSFNDTLSGNAGNNYISGGAGDDTLIATAGTDTLDGGTNTAVGDTADFRNATSSVTIALTDPNPHDLTASGLGMVTLIGIENLSGSAFGDTLTGDGSANTITGGAGNDTINGGGGNDLLIATGGTDILNGGGGNGDTVDFRNATGGVTVSLALTTSQTVGGGLGKDKITNTENLTGSAFNDVLTGEAGNNTVLGMGGDDTIFATTGQDTLDGGTGNNTANFSGYGFGVAVSTGSAAAQALNGTDTVKLLNIQNLTGTSFADTLTGDAGNNILIGGAGMDTLTGNGGTLDIYNGGLGNDTINGTAGSTTDLAQYSGRESLYLVTGTLGTAAPVTVSNGPDAIDTLNNVDRVKFLAPSHVSDVDNNGFGDLLFQNSTTGAIQVNTNNGTVGPASILAGTPADSSWHAVGTGQFTPDAAGAAARASGILLQQAGSGDMEVITGISGTASTTTPLTAAPGTFTGWTALTTGDFNGDGASDVLLSNGSGGLEIAFLNGTVGSAIGTVDSVQSVALPVGFSAVSSGDFNADGFSDILLKDGAGNIQVDLMRGSSVESSAVLPLTAGLTPVGTGDFNGDGKSDVLFTNAAGKAVIWTMDGTNKTGAFAAAAKPNAGSALLGAADMNNDGISDLLWQNGSNVYVSLEDGAGNVTSTLTLNALATNANFHLLASTGGG
jgi:Ca2+-binding RTX toxin-like protein